jgi:hypothetical protein
MLISKAKDTLFELVVQKPVEHAWDRALRNDRILGELLLGDRRFGWGRPSPS